MNHRVKIKESEKMNIYVDLTRVLNRLWSMKKRVIPNRSCCPWNDLQRHVKETREKNRYHADHSPIGIS